MDREPDVAVIERGLLLLRNGEAYPAHEHFEHVFRVSAGESRVLFQALAQLAAGHVQLSLGRARAAARTWEKANAKLRSLHLDVAALAHAQADFLSALHISVEGPRRIDPADLPPQATWPVPAVTMFSDGSTKRRNTAP